MRLHQNILPIIFCFGLLSGFQWLPDTPVMKNHKGDVQAKPFKHQHKDMLEDAIVAEPEDASTVAQKPSLLPFLTLPRTDIATELDALMQKQTGHKPPYIPFIQSITVGVEQINLAKSIWYLFKNLNKSAIHTCYEFSGDLSVLFRGNIRLGSSIGYRSWYTEKMRKNKYAYTCKGWYGGVGIGYLSHFNATNDIYVGINYNRSHFTNTAIDEQENPAAELKALRASWSDIVFGVESRFFDRIPLYGGCALHVGWLYGYTSFKEAKTYYIPGYGTNANKVNLGLDLYLLYKITFVENLINLT
jgi:hypothetical protein